MYRERLRYAVYAGDLRGSFGRRTFVFTAFCVWAMRGVDLKLISYDERKAAPVSHTVG
ncbi:MULTISPECIES: hypothetical protein [Paenibacillus]|uniref:hypothetical protein n=1 Tax=Paenibacillus TaxID=44249 RepID=UPI0004B1533B|nr:MULTISPECIES: hypothetical protein [Paenibacillus]